LRTGAEQAAASLADEERKVREREDRKAEQLRLEDERKAARDARYAARKARKK
jgi:Family of unknown function (DUF6481)